jgi:hypothetical protein
MLPRYTALNTLRRRTSQISIGNNQTRTAQSVSLKVQRHPARCPAPMPCPKSSSTRRREDRPARRHEWRIPPISLLLSAGTRRRPALLSCQFQGWRAFTTRAVSAVQPALVLRINAIAVWLMMYSLLGVLRHSGWRLAAKGALTTT